MGPLLDRVFPLALRCGDDVRSRTSLGRQGRSLGRRAVDIDVAAVHRASPAVLPEVLIVGSGQMASSATERLNELGLPFRVAARDESYAARLAGPGNVCTLDSLVGGVQRADLLICATSASRPLAATRRHLEDESARRVGPLIRAARTQLKGNGRQDLLHRVTVAARAAAAAHDAAALRRLCDAFQVRTVEIGL